MARKLRTCHSPKTALPEFAGHAASALRMLRLRTTVLGVAASWTSVTNRAYGLERTTNLGPASVFQLLRTNVTGLNGTTTYISVSTSIFGNRQGFSFHSE